MERRSADLLIVFAVLSTSLIWSASTAIASSASGCVAASEWFVACSDEDHEGGDSRSRAGGSSGAAPSPAPTNAQGLPLNCARIRTEVFCVDVPTTPEEEVAALPPITTSDVQRLAPGASAFTMEPATWMLRDAPTNFVVRASERIVSATVLGRAVEVRFVPIAYSYDYGDGSSARVTAAGGTWAELGLEEFAATPTSHVFTERGRYTVTASVVYSASYRTGDGEWIPVDGEITAPSTVTGRTLTLDTHLVRGTCAEFPGDPGCTNATRP